MTSDYPTGTPEYPTGTTANPAVTPAYPADTTPAASETDGSGGGMRDAASTAQDKAGELKDSAAESGRHVVGTAQDKAGDVLDEAKYQAKDLLEQTKEELQAQAREQQQRVASGLHKVSGQFDEMAANASEDGMAAHLVRQAADRSRAIGDWLGQREPGGVLDELRDFARRRPGVFIAAAATAGVLAGRLTRGVAAENNDDGGEHV